MKSLMVKHRRDYGFTAVELTVVISIMAIFAALAVLAYDSVRKEVRDQKRETDITVMRNTLEKYYDENGEYPGGGTPQGSGYVIPNDVIVNGSTITDIKQFLPSVYDELRDPFYKRTDGRYIFRNNHTGPDGYFYLGGWTYTNSGGVGTGSIKWFYNTDGGTQVCNYGISMSEGQNASYIIGHYSEKEGNFVFYRGEHGKQWSWPQNPETQPTCVPQN